MRGVLSCVKAKVPGRSLRFCQLRHDRPSKKIVTTAAKTRKGTASGTRKHKGENLYFLCHIALLAVEEHGSGNVKNFESDIVPICLSITQESPSTKNENIELNST